MSDIAERIALLSPEKRALLAARLARDERPVQGHRQASSGEKDVPTPLSYTQRGVWFLDQLYSHNIAYNSPIAVRFSGRLDPKALEWSWNELVRRHALLRSVFGRRNGDVVQYAKPFRFGHLPQMDFNSLPGLEQREAARQEAIREARRRINLAVGPPWRAKLLRCSEQEHVFVVILHHIICDGWSIGVLVCELVAGYEAYMRGESLALPEPQLQYSHYAAAQRRQLEGPDFQRHLESWRKRLEGFTEPVQIPADRPRPAEPTFRGARIFAHLEPQLVESIRRIAHLQNATLFMVLLSAFKVLVSRYSGQTDVILGSPMANRDRRDYENLIGFFANTLALRTDLSGNPTFVELLARVREVTLHAYDSRQIPFEKLVEALQPERKLNRNPFFDISFSLQNFPMPAVNLPDLELELLRIDNGTAKFDLNIVLVESQGGGLATSLEYSTDLFDVSTASRFLRNYTVLLGGVARNPSQRISQYTILSDVERDQILRTWNATAVEYPRGRRVEDLFIEQAKRTPQAVAVQFGEHALRYAELDDQSDRVAHFLRSLGVSRGANVAICAKPSTQMIVGLLGILKAKAAYVPIDPKYPEERISIMLTETRAELVLTDRELAARLSEIGIKSVCLEECCRPIAAKHHADSEFCSAEETAYILFTSGSTGRPKGVCVPHQGISRLVVNCDYVSLTAEDVVAQVSNCAFDAATFEIWGALLNGSRLVGIEHEDLLSPQSFAAELARHGVTTLLLTTAVFNELAHERPNIFYQLRNVLFGGEAADPDAVRKVLKNGPPQRLLNVYGPTETTTFATWYEIKPEQSCADRIPIGRPIANTQVYILDAQLSPVPIGVTGEICIAGEGVARGYLNEPELTAERFIQSPFASGERLYRTGDLGRFLADGNIDFLGRRDRQVKMRGFRIEPGEIEAALAGHPKVRQATVYAHESGGVGSSTSRPLVAYVVLVEGAIPDGIHEGLTSFLMGKLPEYMVPSAFVVLQKLPLTPNGKIDYKALPSPEWKPKSDGAPRTPEEEMLCGIYADLLSLDHVGIHDSFFSLGGHSLMAMRLINRLKGVFGVELSVRTVFEAPSVAKLVARLPRVEKASAPLLRRERPQNPPLSFAQERLWFLDRLEASSSTEYNMSQALRLRGELDIKSMERAIAALVERHEILRTHFGEQEGEPFQIVSPQLRVPLGREDLSGLSADLQAKAIEAVLRREAEESFDLSAGPLLRTGLIRLGPQDHIFHWTCHHAIFDGWSAGIFGKELSHLYAAFCEERSADLAALPVQYADYALWQRQRMDGGELGRLADYWRGQLSDLPVLDLPIDRPRGASPNFEGNAHSALLPRSLCQDLRNLADAEGANMAMVLLAALELLLGRLGSQEDVAVGLPIAGRSSLETEDLIGLFVNTLVLRAKLEGKLSFRGLLAQVHKTFLDALAYQEMPFEKLVEIVNPERVLNRHPLFEVLFNYISFSRAWLDLPGLSVERIGHKSVQAKFPITLYVEEASEGLMLKVVYQTALFIPERIRHLVDQFQCLLSQIARDADLPIYAYSLVTSDARKMLPDPTILLPEPEQIPVTRRFLLQADLQADRSALRHEGREWSYRELAKSAQQIARLLTTQGVRPGEVVAVTGQRSFGLISGILGVLLVRGVLLTLDSSLPSARKDEMLHAASGKHWLSIGAEEKGSETFQALPVTRISLDGDPVDPHDRTLSEGKVPGTAGADDPAYVFFTSGTTGVPKGILGSHKGLSHFIEWERNTLQITTNDRVAQLTALSFDVVLRDIFLPLCSGATLCLPDTASVPHSDDVVGWMRRERITILHTVPSLAAAWLDSREAAGGLPNLRWTLMAGEPLTETLVRRWREQMGTAHEILNLYGPTETTLAKCAYRVPAEPSSGVQPIGDPLPDSQALIINKADQLCGLGEPGEIVMRTPFRSLGYLNADRGERRRFVSNPFRDDLSDVVYRTGDCGSYRHDGLLRITGRLDDQVKIRGSRVEPAEVAAVLGQYPETQECAVVAREAGSGEMRLFAYLVLSPTAAKATASGLRDYLKQKLPDYMIPTGFVVLDKLPLTPNGKLDRRALPALDPLPSAEHHVAPRDLTERILTNLWCDLLKLDEVGVQDDFFALGGHSLLATRLVSQIRSQFEVEIPLRVIFENPTIEGLALQVTEKLATSILSEGVEGVLSYLEALPEAAAEGQLTECKNEGETRSGNSDGGTG